MGAVRLPVAGLDVDLRLPDGADDILLLEAGTPDMRLALALLARVAHRVDGAPLDPAALPIGDVDVLLLLLRQKVIGDVVSAEGVCAAPGCNTRVDITFSIHAYLEHHRPEYVPPVPPADEEGWYQLSDEAGEFRLPLAVDQLAIGRADRPEQALFLRCIRPATISDAALKQVEAAMEAMAPNLCAELQAICPACRATVEASFDPVQYTLRELRDQAAYVYDEVCSIAHHYHWSEAEILALPAARRARYAELADQRAGTERTSA